LRWFRKVFTYYNTVYEKVYGDAAEYLEMIKFSPRIERMMTKLGDRGDEFLKRLKVACQEVLDSGELITFDHLVIIGIK